MTITLSQLDEEAAKAAKAAKVAAQRADFLGRLKEKRRLSDPATPYAPADVVSAMNQLQGLLEEHASCATVRPPPLPPAHSALCLSSLSPLFVSGQFGVGFDSRSGLVANIFD
jgi:hypothetical protein